jgi:hypothetical protein
MQQSIATLIQTQTQILALSIHLEAAGSVTEGRESWNGIEYWVKREGGHIIDREAVTDDNNAGKPSNEPATSDSSSSPPLTQKTQLPSEIQQAIDQVIDPKHLNELSQKLQQAPSDIATKLKTAMTGAQVRGIQETIANAFTQAGDGIGKAYREAADRVEQQFSADGIKDISQSFRDVIGDAVDFAKKHKLEILGGALILAGAALAALGVTEIAASGMGLFRALGFLYSIRKVGYGGRIVMAISLGAKNPATKVVWGSMKLNDGAQLAMLGAGMAGAGVVKNKILAASNPLQKAFQTASTNLIKEAQQDLSLIEGQSIAEGFGMDSSQLTDTDTIAQIEASFREFVTNFSLDEKKRQVMNQSLQSLADLLGAIELAKEEESAETSKEAK